MTVQMSAAGHFMSRCSWIIWLSIFIAIGGYLSVFFNVMLPRKDLGAGAEAAKLEAELQRLREEAAKWETAKRDAELRQQQAEEQKKIGAANSALDEALDKLVAGNIAFNTPEHVRLGKPQIIEAKLAVNFSGDALVAQLNEVGKKEKSPIQVADRMAATLSGGTAFHVSPSGPQQQLISHTQVTTWTWEVTAKQPGTQYLFPSVDAVLTIDSKEGTRNINTFKRTIEVEVAWPETASEWFQWVKEWFENISWLWATLLVPVALWMRSRFRKKTPAPEQPTRHRGAGKRV
jgi:hypothetical protein